LLNKADLEAIRLDVEPLSDADLLDLAKGLYRNTYLNKGHVGEMQTHDGQTVLFFERQFEHAFWSSPDKHASPHLKVRLARERIARLRWIGPLLTGEVAGSECWEGSGLDANRHHNRLYLISDELYVAFLEPRDHGGWKFWTAFPATRERIQEYKRGRRLVRRWG